jgi:AAA+ superfamily predicted ATPase
MTRYINTMNFPLPKGTPKQQLVMRKFKKMAINVQVILKYCFPSKPAPNGKGYSASHHQHKHLKTSMKDVLFELANTCKLMNPVRGVVPGLPFCQ